MMVCCAPCLLCQELNELSLRGAQSSSERRGEHGGVLPPPLLFPSPTGAAGTVMYVVPTGAVLPVHGAGHQTQMVYVGSGGGSGAPVQQQFVSTYPQVRECMVHGAWCMVRGAWCMVHGAWCMVHGAWCMVCGAWCVVHGAWCMVRGAWLARCVKVVNGGTAVTGVWVGPSGLGCLNGGPGCCCGWNRPSCDPIRSCACESGCQVRVMAPGATTTSSSTTTVTRGPGGATIITNDNNNNNNGSSSSNNYGVLGLVSPTSVAARLTFGRAQSTTSDVGDGLYMPQQQQQQQQQPHYAMHTSADAAPSQPKYV